jgi:DNA (cytosine-5)-methyltransferase 1
VDQLQPRYWILENVPRVKSILQTHVYGNNGKLRQFRRLFETDGVHVRLFDMSHFGLPQKRVRCLAGKFPVEFLDSYIERCSPRTLGSVLESFNGEVVRSASTAQRRPAHVVTCLALS